MGNSIRTMKPMDESPAGSSRTDAIIEEWPAMKRLCLLVVCVWLGVGAASAQAQFIIWNPFRKASPPPPPAERVSQLVSTIKSETDERKRTSAVEELRDFDTKVFAE